MNTSTRTDKNHKETKSSNSSKTPSRDTENLDRLSTQDRHVDKTTGRPAEDHPDNDTYIDTQFHAWLGKNPDSSPGTREAFYNALNVGIPVDITSALLSRSSENAKILAQLK